MKNHAFLHKSSIHLSGWCGDSKVHSVYMGELRFERIEF